MPSVEFTRALDGIKTSIWPTHVVEVRATCPGDGPQGTLIVKTTADPDTRTVVSEDYKTVVARLNGNSPPSQIVSTFDTARSSSLFTFSDGNLTATQGGGADGVNNDPRAFTTLFHSDGVRVFRFTLKASKTIGTAECAFGLATATAASGIGGANWLGQDHDSVGVFDDGGVCIGGKVVGNMNGFQVNDTIDIVVDLTNKTLANSVNGGALSAAVDIGMMSSFSLSPALSGDQTGYQATFNGNPSVSFPGALPWDG